MKVHFNIFLTFFLSILGLQMAAQICDGNLGENIFFDGDFGSGADNNVIADPGIAPGYTYTSTGPPVDGFYVLTNDTRPWDNFPTWLNIGDNSNDDQGYMMVVNASFEPGIFYEQTISGFCENTIYEFSADVINLIQRNVQDHIKPNVDFLIDGMVQYSTGDIPQDETWNKYGFTFTAPTDRTEITLTLRNNAPGGIGNDLAIDNISFRACGPRSFINTERTLFFCEEANTPAAIIADVGTEPRALQWQISLDQGITWTDITNANAEQYLHTNFDPGTYMYRYLSAGTEENLENILCRVISDELTLIVNPIYHELFDTICEGTSFMLGDLPISASGIYMADLTGQDGCDSNVTLNLTVVEDPLIDFDLIGNSLICANDTNGIIQFGNGVNGYPPYQYFFNQAEVFDQVSDLDAGNYTVEVIDRFGCSAEKEVFLSEPAPFVVEAGNNIDTVLGAFIQLNATANDLVSNQFWEPPIGLSCADCPNPNFISGNSLIYVYTASNSSGCTDSDSLIVKVNKDKTPLFVPNAFSPNGDNINDILSISSFAQSVQEILDFKVFDRWGGLRFQKSNFQSNDPSLGWDGNSNGKRAPSGVYVYVIKLRLVDGSEQLLKGDVTLIR